MSGTYVWGAMGRGVDDSTTVDEAISEAIDAHLADPDAHLDATGSLQSHRAAEIIDHLAESVVNDKIAPIARTYTAIVDPDSDVDFDTIQAALDYTVGKGGGTIFVRAGTHYISGVVFWPNIVNMVGEDVNTTIIVTDYDNGDYFLRSSDPEEDTGNFFFESLTFNAVSENVFYGNYNTEYSKGHLQVRDCSFTGAGGYFYFAAESLVMDNCTIELGAAPAVQQLFYTAISNTMLTTTTSSGTKKFLSNDFDGEYYNIILYNVYYQSEYVTNVEYFGALSYYNCSAIACRFYNWAQAQPTFTESYFLGCNFSTKTGQDMAIETVGTQFLACGFGGSSSDDFNWYSGGSADVMIGCYGSITIVESTGNAIMRLNGPESDFYNHSNSATAMGLKYYRHVQLTPNSTRTLTTTVPRAGEQRTIIFLTSGTTSYTMTFGTGFKTTGTLATGGTSARRFVMEFVSDGTYLIEMSRTTAIA